MYKNGMDFASKSVNKKDDDKLENGRGSGKMPPRNDNYGKFPYGGSSSDGSTGGIIPLGKRK